MKNEKNIIDGYLFDEEEVLKEAKTELEGVEYLRKRTNYSSPKNVLNIYRTVIEKNLFKTPIGYEYLRELQAFLYNHDEIDKEDILPIPVYIQKSKKTKIKFNLPKVKKSLDKSSPYRNRFLNMVILNVVLVIILLLFVFISNNSKNLNIINYKHRIDAEYIEKEDNLAKWASELESREEALYDNYGGNAE